MTINYYFTMNLFPLYLNNYLFFKILMKINLNLISKKIYFRLNR